MLRLLRSSGILLLGVAQGCDIYFRRCPIATLCELGDLPSLSDRVPRFCVTRFGLLTKSAERSNKAKQSKELQPFNFLQYVPNLA